MLSPDILKRLHTNQRLLVLELQERGVEVSPLDPDIELLELKYRGHSEYLLDRFSNIFPYTQVELTRDKCLAKFLLQRAGLHVSEGKIFDCEQVPAALKYAAEVGFPVVIKPNWGSHGDGVYMDIVNKKHLEEIIQKFLIQFGRGMPFLVEKQFEGKEHRIFITKSGAYAAVHRDPAHVIGDGKRSIKELAELETKKRLADRSTCLCPIVLDEVVDAHLLKSGKTLDSVPKKGELVYLRKVSNVAKGGDCNDATEQIHPSVIEIAKKVMKVFDGIPFAGIDFLTVDPGIAQNKNTYRILEVNPNPGFSLHMKPGRGKPRNVAKLVADLMFPETVN